MLQNYKYPKGVCTAQRSCQHVVEFVCSLYVVTMCLSLLQSSSELEATILLLIKEMGCVILLSLQQQQTTHSVVCIR